MSQKDIIKELVGLQDVIVNKVEQSEKEIYIYIDWNAKSIPVHVAIAPQIKYTITDCKKSVTYQCLAKNHI